jgi:hypothetical protein
LEREIALAVAGAYPWRLRPPEPASPAGAPRLLSLGELEGVRDALADRLSDVRWQIAQHAEAAAERRVLVEKMLAHPKQYKWMRVRDEDSPSCRSWHVRPRYGLIGMLAGWWHVKISSGCPLRVAA